MIAYPPVAARFWRRVTEDDGAFITSPAVRVAQRLQLAPQPGVITALGRQERITPAGDNQIVATSQRLATRSPYSRHHGVRARTPVTVAGGSRDDRSGLFVVRRRGRKSRTPRRPYGSQICTPARIVRGRPVVRIGVRPTSYSLSTTFSTAKNVASLLAKRRLP